MSEGAHSRLLWELREHAVLHGEFVLSSGARSTYYLDARRVTLSATGAALVGELFLDALAETGISGVAGLTLGADPIVSAIVTLAGTRDMRLDGFLVRKEAKGHGTARRIEGPWRPGLRVAVVDDTLTTGSSSLAAAAAVEEAGSEVTGIYALIDREQGAREALAAAGYKLTVLFTARELLGHDM